MSSLRNPVGPQPASVYWRRRIVVLLGLIAVIVVVVLLFVPKGQAPKPASTGSPTPTPTAAAGGPCDPAQVTLTPNTDAAGYDPGVTPQLFFVVTSKATEPCTISAGSDVTEYRITSGDELIWSSKDCQSDPQASTATLQPGVPVQSPSIPWDRTRSSTDTCASARPEVTAGGASYHLEVVLGDVESTESRQFVLY